MTDTSAPQPADPSGGTGQDVGRDYLVRSEEQMHVGTEQVIAGYARLEKFVVTETKTITVEVTHEEVRLVHTRDTGLQRPAGSTAPADSTRWMVLSREEVVIEKRVVPVERVRAEVFSVTEDQQITEEVRKEQIDTAPETAWAADRGSTTSI